jgi:hypothetical protein
MGSPQPAGKAPPWTDATRCTTLQLRRARAALPYTLHCPLAPRAARARCLRPQLAAACPLFCPLSSVTSVRIRTKGAPPSGRRPQLRSARPLSPMILWPRRPTPRPRAPRSRRAHIPREGAWGTPPRPWKIPLTVKPLAHACLRAPLPPPAGASRVRAVAQRRGPPSIDLRHWLMPPAAGPLAPRAGPHCPHSMMRCLRHHLFTSGGRLRPPLEIPPPPPRQTTRARSLVADHLWQITCGRSLHCCLRAKGSSSRCAPPPRHCAAPAAGCKHLFARSHHAPRRLFKPARRPMDRARRKAFCSITHPHACQALATNQGRRLSPAPRAGCRRRRPCAPRCFGPPAGAVADCRARASAWLETAGACVSLGVRAPVAAGLPRLLGMPAGSVPGWQAPVRPTAPRPHSKPLGDYRLNTRCARSTLRASTLRARSAPSSSIWPCPAGPSRRGGGGGGPPRPAPPAATPPSFAWPARRPRPPPRRCMLACCRASLPRRGTVSCSSCLSRAPPGSWVVKHRNRGSWMTTPPRSAPRRPRRLALFTRRAACPAGAAAYCPFLRGERRPRLLSRARRTPAPCVQPAVWGKTKAGAGAAQAPACAGRR